MGNRKEREYLQLIIRSVLREVHLQCLRGLFYSTYFWSMLCIITIRMNINIKIPNRSYFISLSAFYFSFNSTVNEKAAPKNILLLNRAAFSFQHVKFWWYFSKFCSDLWKEKGDEEEESNQALLSYSNDTSTSLVTGANIFLLQWSHRMGS